MRIIPVICGGRLVQRVTADELHQLYFAYGARAKLIKNRRGNPVCLILSSPETQTTSQANTVFEGGSTQSILKNLDNGCQVWELKNTRRAK